MTLRCLDLFSGIGCFSLGLQRGSDYYIHTEAFCEYEDWCKRVLAKNFPDKPVHGNIENLSVKEGEWDIMCGGFPCTDISIAGKGVGIEGEKSGLWSHFYRLIKEGKPKYVAIENVSALTGRGLERILHQLAKIGYDASWTMYDSQFFGVPQRRRRVYILAFRDGIKEGIDVFDNERRSCEELRQEVQSFKEGRRWNFQEGGEGWETASFYTRQRSDQFDELGVASTLCKRDYKDFTDIVEMDGEVRKLLPVERMRLQGIPDNWVDGCSLTNQQMYMATGMTVPVVEHLGKIISHYDKHHTTR